MTTRHWKLVVTEIGATGAVAETIVEAPNWMAGIKLARGRIGEPEAIPQGASCTVAPDGRVTVFDAARRRSYVLSPLGDGGELASQVSYPPGVFTASQVPAPPPPSPPSSPGAPAPVRQRPKTMAYIMDGPLPPPPGAAPIAISPPMPLPAPAAAKPADAAPTSPLGAPAPAASAKSAMRRTMAFVPGQFDLPPLPNREVVVGTQTTKSSAPPVIPAPTAAPSQAPAAPSVLFEQDVPPNDESPLHYHLVGLLLAGNRSTVEIERAMFSELRRVKAAIAGEIEGHLIQVFAYREPVDGPTEGAEIAQLTWRGWRGETNVRFPKLEDEVAAQTIPGAERYPSAAADPRLADVLDAFEDVWFLATPEAGLEFVARIAEDLFGGAHVMCAGLSPTGSEFLPVTERGSLPGYKLAPKLEPTGLVALALASAGRPIVLESASSDPRVVAAVEGPVGPILAAVAPHGGEALGYVRLARPKGGPNFGMVDAEILRAIVERLGLFLRLRGACITRG